MECLITNSEFRITLEIGYFELKIKVRGLLYNFVVWCGKVFEVYYSMVESLRCGAWPGVPIQRKAKAESATKAAGKAQRQWRSIVSASASRPLPAR